MAVASSFSFARAAVNDLRAACTFASVATSNSASSPAGRSRRAARLQNATSTGEVAIEQLELVDAATDRRLLAKPRAEGYTQERIEHVARRERQDRARQ